MKRDNKLMKFAVLVLLITLLALILVSGTYAKYTTTASGSDTVTVAKFVVGGPTDERFDLFTTTTYEEDGTTEDSDVVAGKIAPGTGGKIDIELTNSSEVTVDYVLELEEENTANVPIVYSIDGTTYVSADKIADLVTGTLTIGSTNTQTKIVTIYWKWVYENGTGDTLATNDATDTVIGQLATAPTVTVTASVTFTQAD